MPGGTVFHQRLIGCTKRWSKEEHATVVNTNPQISLEINRVQLLCKVCTTKCVTMNLICIMRFAACN